VPIASLLPILLTAWLALVVVLGAKGAYLGSPGRPPLAVFASAVVPIALFGAALRGWTPFREFLLGVDTRLLVAFQAWRFVGFGFVALYANDVLPGLFAWPAGLGDIAIAIAAPWWVVELSRDPQRIASARFRRWNWLGLLDFVVAFSTATICVMFLSDAQNAPTIAPLARLPLVLVPTFFVPIFAMTHITTLVQSRQHAAANAAA
jgi:hypothetical protein